MQTNNHKIVDYDAVLDAKFGKEGTPERARAEEAAYSFYSWKILHDARREAKVTQKTSLLRKQLASRDSSSHQAEESLFFENNLQKI